MGTRGFITFVVNTVEKTSYNHFDSYPSALGADMYHWVKDVTQPVDDGDLKISSAERIESVRERIRALRVIEPNDAPPNGDDIAALIQYANTGVGGHNGPITWYQLLRETQGNPYRIVNAGVIESAYNFPTDSLFAEWGYVVDFDTNIFEVYQGFQTAEHDIGRFTGRNGHHTHGYKPVKLIAWWPFNRLPASEAEFLHDVNTAAEHD